MAEKMVIASDHAAFEAKQLMRDYLIERGFDVIDLGPDSADSVDYPVYAAKLARKVVEENCRGVLLCGSGIGVSMVANRFKGVRAALVRTTNEAHLCKQHNNANVLCMGGRITPFEDMKKLFEEWHTTEFEGGRHQGRIDMFTNLGIE